MRVIQLFGAALLGVTLPALAAAEAVDRAAPRRLSETRFSNTQTLHLEGRVVIDHPVEVPAGAIVTLYTTGQVELTGDFTVIGGGVFSILPVPETAAGAQPSGTAEAPALGAPDPGLAVRTFGGRLEFALARPAQLTVAVLDVQGRSIVRLPRQEFSAAIHTIDLNRRGATPGLYFYRIDIGGLTRAGKLVVVR